jgi:Zn-dependent protease/CBS domain-containing protein
VRRGFRLGTVLGIEVIVDLSLLVVASLLTWSLYIDVERAFPTTDSNLLLVASLLGGVLFFGSVFLHELSHSVVAARRGLTVRRIRLFIFGGVSEIEEEASSPSDELAVTVAGPAASAVLGVLFLLVAWLLPGSVRLAARLSAVLGVANLSIAVFNLLPGLPLDGGRVLRAFVWRRSGDRERATRLAVRTGRGLGLLLVVGGVALLFLVGDFSAIWLAAVGWFLYQAAATSALQEALTRRIEGMTIGDAMRRTDLAIDGAVTIAEALQLHGWGERLRSMPVVIDGRVRGVFGDREIKRVETSHRAVRTVESAMTPIGPGDVIEVGEPLRSALARETGRAGILVVVDAGRVVGMLTAEELATLFRDLRR